MGILVDSNEPFSIKRKLKKAGIPFQVKRLKVGDYAWNTVGIERKEAHDFYNSIYGRGNKKGRLFEQLYQLKQYKIPILVVQGNLYPEKRYLHIGKGRRITVPLTKEEKDRRLKTKNSILARLPFSYSIYFFNVQDEDEFIEFLGYLYLSTIDRETYKPVSRKGQSIEEIKENMLTALPGIGRKRAKAILKEMTIQELANSPLEDILKIKGLGKKRAAKILEALTT